MADFIASAEIRDNMSAGANAAAAALNKLADAADSMTVSVTKAGPSADALVRKFDPATAAAVKLTKAQRDLAAAIATMDAEVAAGNRSIEQRNAVVDGASAKVQALTTATANAVPVSDKLGASHGETAFATRQLGVQMSQLFSGIATGQPVMMSLIQQGHQVGDVMLSTGVGVRGMASAIASMITPTVAMVAAGAALVGGLGYLGYAYETNQRQLLAMQTALRATTDDYVALGAQADKAARAVAATSAFSLADTRAASTTIGDPAKGFAGSNEQLQALIRTAGDLATVIGGTLPAAAAKLAAAMQDPAKTAQDWANTRSFGMTQALADQIKAMADSGDKAGAFNAELDLMKSKIGGAAEASKTDLQKALEALDNAFKSVNSSGASFSVWLGKGIDAVAVTFIEQLKEIIDLVGAAKNLASSAISSAPSGVFPGGTYSGSGDPLIASVGARLHVSSAVIDMGNKIATQEGGGQIRHTDANGNVITSPAGAMGEFQLMPKTAAGLLGGVNPANQTENIAGGLTHISQLMTKYNGDPALVAMAYNWGEGNVDKFRSGAKSVGDVPGETKKYVQAVAGVSVNSIATYGGTIDVTGRSPGTGVANTGVLDQALAKANGAGTAAGAATNATADIKLYTAALAELAAKGDTSSDSVLKLQQALAKAQVAFQDAKTPADALIDSIGRQVDAQDKITAAYAGGADAVAHATNLAKAEEDARKMAGVTTDNYLVTVLKLTAAYDDLTASQSRNKAVLAEQDQADQIQYLQAESAAVNQSAASRERDLAALKERQTIQKTMPGLDDAEKEKLVANAQAIADATSNLQLQQASVQAISSALTNAFDQVGQAITNAFVSGNGAAVNWGNVTRGVIASVLQEVLKLAVINPLMNAALGTASPTLGSVASVLGAGGTVAGAAGGGSGMSLLGTASSLYSIGKGLIGGTGTVSSTLDGYASSLLPGLFSSEALPAAAYTALPAGVSGPVASGTSGLIGSTASSFLGGVGAGFGAGSLLNSLVGGNQMNGTIGSGIGAVAGQALIPIPIVGGLIGGALGGLLGGMIGPNPASSYSTASLSVANGQLVKGQMIQQGDMQRAVQTDNNLTSQVGELNNFASGNGIQVIGYKSQLQVGDNSNRSAPDPTKYADLNTPNMTGKTALSQLTYSASNQYLNTFLQNNSFSNLPELEAAVTNVQTFINTTVPQLIALGKTPAVAGTVPTQVDALNAAFEQAINNAGQLGMATGDLAAAWGTAIDKVRNDAGDALLQTDKGLTSRYLNAAATVSGSANDNVNAQLYAFDIAAQPQRDQFSASLTATYGDAFKTTQEYADQMAMLEKTLGEERLAIQQSYNDKLTATAAGAVTSLGAEVTKLQTGSASPLSPSAQYTLATNQFNATAGAAQAGDYNSYSSISQYADSFLSASRAYNGSGTAYASDYTRVLDVLNSLTTLSVDTLTASVYVAQTQTQTQVLVASLAAVQSEVAALRLAVQQGSSAPARLAA